ncbi:VOC family protein [Streptomyces sp. PTM05]|uniref:VOC family protein n=1 Tax=Streptantibioticus parmotrematis TaxID=2873249 RepID=A0ABS7QL45_9ACTN|nr:VOC family protein [Streptantibioticus parmotrematis]MBY8883917.1 VOC family protein [Streptantibioticus parmotrematis]
MLTTRYVPGAPNWVDLGTPDTQAAAEFYGELFGWVFRSAGPEAGGYGMFTLDGATVAAVGPLTEEAATSAWTLYFTTADADATAKAVEQAGGQIRSGPYDVFTAGRTAGLTDPTGAEFAVWQPGGTKGLDAVTDPGTLCWTELHSTDPARAKDFYASVFDWDAQESPMEGFTYTVVSPTGAGAEAAHGGIMPVAENLVAAGTPSGWRPYFEVADADAAAATTGARGGSVIMPPEEIPGVGRSAVLADPFGALFAVITSAPAAA